jgi:hypothetical protein
MVKVNANKPVLVLYNTLDCINPVATKKKNLETVKVKLLDLLYLTTILIHAFLILLFSVEHVSIYVIPLICHNGEYRAMSQLF